MNLENKAAFMSSIRKALGYPADGRRPAPPGLFHDRPSEKSIRLLERIRTRGPADRQTLMETLRQAAAPINLDVRLVTSARMAAAQIADTIAEFPTEWGGPRKVCAWDHPLIAAMGLSTVLAERGIPVVSESTALQAATGGIPDATARASLRRGIIESFVGVTAADYCVADTATLVLRTHPGCPRSVSLVPSLHIAVITADQIVADLGELYALLRWDRPGEDADLTTCMSFISGPSKTADIEATLVHGAHGPRSVSLYVITEA
jgi:L-lactate dehydrogenase complex protein LldG